jgi:hypothetical protein
MKDTVLAKTKNNIRTPNKKFAGEKVPDFLQINRLYCGFLTLR